MGLKRAQGIFWLTCLGDGKAMVQGLLMKLAAFGSLLAFPAVVLQGCGDPGECKSTTPATTDQTTCATLCTNTQAAIDATQASGTPAWDATAKQCSCGGVVNCKDKDGGAASAATATTAAPASG